MSSRLLRRARPAIVVLVACAVVVTALGLLVHNDRTGNWLDNRIAHRIIDDIPAAVVHFGLHLTDPPLIAGLVGVVVLAAAATRRWAVAALAILAPALSVLLTEDGLKPLVNRTAGVVVQPHHEGLRYPSGHETGVASLAVLVGVLLLATNVRVRTKIAGLTVLAAIVVLAAVALIGGSYHYATDTVGAVGVAVTVVLAVALAIDQVGALLRTRQAVRQPV